MNLRPSGYEPDELPDCSTPRRRESSIQPHGDALRGRYNVWAEGGGGGGDEGSAADGGGAGAAVGPAAADSGVKVSEPCCDSCACSAVTKRSMSASVLGVERPVLDA